MILLDTDVSIDILRKHPPAMAWIQSVQDPVCLPGIVALELYQGCHNKGEVTNLNKQIAPFAILWPTEAECGAAFSSFAMAHLTHALGLLDALIAATALSYGVPLAASYFQPEALHRGAPFADNSTLRAVIDGEAEFGFCVCF